MRLLKLKAVLAATALESASRHALRAARALAQASGARLHVVHVSTTAADEHATRNALQRIEKLPDDAVLHVLFGDPATLICRLADEVGADVLVLGPHRQLRAKSGVDKSADAASSTALAVVRAATTPCLVVRQRFCLPLDRVVVAVDGSPASQRGLMVALSWASALRGPHASTPTKLIVLNVRRVADASASVIDEALAQLQHDAGTWSGVAIETAPVVNDDVPRGIAEYANQQTVDLVVLGTRGVGPAAARLGSVTASAVHQLDASVLLVPPGLRLGGDEGSRERGRSRPKISSEA